MKFTMRKKSKSKSVVPFDSGSPFGKGTKAAYHTSTLIGVKKKRKKK